MKYIGNTALSPQIQERILTTFEQTLSLAREGNRQEAQLGCDFILRLDPLFEPARRLQERLDESEGPVDVSDLATSQEPEVAAVAPEHTLEQQDLSEPVDIGALISSDGWQEPMTDGLATRMAMLLEQRSFQDLISLATENQDRVTADAELRQFVELASERLEAEPYVRNFLQSARSARERGDLETARLHLEKARELDSSHPELIALAADLPARAAVEPPEAFEPVSLVETPPLIGQESFPSPTSEVDDLFDAVDEVSVGDEALLGVDEVTPSESMTTLPTLDAEPSARLDTESEQRIAVLLKEGQEAFEDGHYQAAIDAWSRIFLIDIDHAEASRRIELARKLKAEVERQIEETFHEGISLLEAGDEEQAREAFAKVLEIQPNHLGAHDYLEKLSSGDLATGRTSAPDLAPLVEAPSVAPAATETFGELDLAPPVRQVTARPGDLAPEEIEPIPPAKRSRGRSFLFIGASVLLLVLAVGWFVYSKWDQFFPGSADSAQAGQTRPQIDPIERARELHEAGNTAMAISVLRRLPPGHEQYAEALALITMWEEGGQPAEDEGEQISEVALARRAEMVTRAEQLAAGGQNLLALGLLEKAAQISALSEDEAALKVRTEMALELLADERDLFEQGDWEYALPSLWRLYEADNSNQDVVQLIVDSYYNLGLRDLQRGDVKSALEKFEEAQTLSKDNAELDRLAEFTKAYINRPADMLFRIFVKYQKFR